MTPFMGVSGLGGAGSLIGASIPSVLSKNYWHTLMVGQYSSGADYNCYTLAVDNESGAVFCAGGGRVRGTGTADSCFATKLDADGSLGWTRSFRSNAVGSEFFYGMDCDSDGNVYAIGWCSNNSGPGSFTNGGNDIILVKWDTDGNKQWNKSLGHSGTDRGYDIKIDSSDNIFIVGYTAQSGNTYVLVAKYNTSGVLQWQNSFGDTYDQYGYGIDTDGSGNIYVCSPYFTSPRKSSLYKLNSSGTIQWARLLTNPSGDAYANNCATDSSGNVYVPITGTLNYNGDWRLLKFDTNGNLQWERNISGSEYDGVKGVVVDSQDNVIVAGEVNNGVPPGFSTGVFATIVKYNSSGTLQWQRHLYANLNEDSGHNVNEMEIDKEDNLYVACTAYYNSGLGNNPAAAAVVFKVPSDGTLTGTYNSDVAGTVTYATVSYSTSTSQGTMTASNYTPTSVTPTLNNLDGASLYFISNSSISVATNRTTFQ